MNIHDRFIRIKTVQERTSLSRATIYRQMQKGIFPKQVSIGDMRRGWRESDINKWMEDPVRWRTSMSEEKQPKKILMRKSKDDPLQHCFKEFEEMDKQKV